MNETEAIEKARQYFLDNQNSYGCAETTFMVLKEAFGLPEVGDSSPAMALNGGIAYRGSVCGAITGAVLAVGMLAERRQPDHKLAKLSARQRVDRLIDHFEAMHGAVNCRELIGTDLRDENQHLQFIQSGLWRTRCMGQIETVIRYLNLLADEW
jgi:C_GCAxxG_C_C family probable redox protein